MSATDKSAIRFRRPTAADGAAMWDLVRRAGGLDLNSPYAYLMACRNWPDWCVIAQSGQGLAGIIVGYPMPARPDTLFVWQIGVCPDHRGQGLGRTMLAWLIRSADQPPRWMETTITPSNTASRALFKSFARSMKVAAAQAPWLSAGDFPDQRAGDFPDQHEGEDLFRIGPFDSSKE
jgi:L-2,4-diaminobutyric acid acetyltransferase